MRSSGENIRFEVSVNGEYKATTGIESNGVLTVAVHWVRRNPADLPGGAAVNSEISVDEWVRDEIELNVGGLDIVTRQHLEWFNGQLRVGDVVTIRILPPGEFDDPTVKGKSQQKG